MDLFYLHDKLGIDRILKLAKQKDAGLDRHVLATMLARFDRLPRDEFAVDDRVYSEMKSFFEQLQADLIGQCVGEH